MRAGKLFHPITVQEPTATADSYGGNTIAWSTHATSRAGIYPVKGVETVIDGKLTMVTRFVISMRYVAGITPGMRILKDLDSRTFEILSVKNIDERNKQIDLLCKEYV